MMSNHGEGLNTIDKMGDNENVTGTFTVMALFPFIAEIILLTSKLDLLSRSP